MTYHPDRLEHARSLQDQLIAWRRDIHAHPELGFEEYRTAKLVAETLNSLGIEAQTGVGKTGVVARLGEGKPVIGIRADMDALPILEDNPVDYASQNPYVMHACGHDAHTAILMGVAQMLTEIPASERPSGEIRLLFQPCEEKQDEEGKSGAMRMIEEGALDGVDHVIALHVASGLEAGKIEIRSGYAMANADMFTATIYGTGGHGASPHRGTDPVFMLAQLLNVIYGIPSRRINPVQPCVISIGTIHAGVANNVIPAEITLTGTIRSYNDETRKQLHDELEKAFGVVKALGGDYELKIDTGFDATYNDPAVSKLIEQVTGDLLGADRLEPPEAGMGAEDFGYMTRLAPGAMFMLGAKYDDMDRGHHTPVFNIDESVMPVGAAMLVETAFRLLQQK
jgi:amidohydrolase